MIQTLAIDVEANATISTVAAVGEAVNMEVEKISEDVVKVATKMDTIEEEVCATILLDQTNSRVERVEGTKQENSTNGGGVGN